MLTKKNKSVVFYIIYIIFFLAISGYIIKGYIDKDLIEIINESPKKFIANRLNRIENIIPTKKKTEKSAEKTTVMEQNYSSNFTGKIEMIAYRLAVIKGQVSLASTTHIRGDFHRRRSSLPRLPGMWSVQLLDDNMNVLDEDIIRNPNEECHALDPLNLDSKGNPQISQFAGASNDTMVQVRFHTNDKAKWIKIYSLNSSKRVNSTSTPTEQLISVLSLK